MICPGSGAIHYRRWWLIRTVGSWRTHMDLRRVHHMRRRRTVTMHAVLRMYWLVREWMAHAVMIFGRIRHVTCHRVILRTEPIE